MLARETFNNNRFTQAKLLDSYVEGLEVRLREDKVVESSSKKRVLSDDLALERIIEPSLHKFKFN